ncbi:hypothetical protein LBG_03570 [Stenotrophomonas maltophilia]|nr:hypothetical protein LBG_03570 [Stenotrophomonas maltophilia]
MGRCGGGGPPRDPTPGGGGGAARGPPGGGPPPPPPPPPAGGGGGLGGWAMQRRVPIRWGLFVHFFGANGPAHPHHPTPDSFPVTVGFPRFAWKRCIGKQEGVGSVFLRKTDPTPTISTRLLLLLLLLIFFFLPAVAAAENCQRPGGWAGRGCQPHGCGCQAYKDVLAASPEQPTYPAQQAIPLLNPPQRGLSPLAGKLSTPPPAHPCGSPTHRNKPRSRDHA